MKFIAIVCCAVLSFYVGTFCSQYINQKHESVAIKSMSEIDKSICSEFVDLRQYQLCKNLEELKTLQKEME
jgi:hypothetical protein